MHLKISIFLVADQASLSITWSQNPMTDCVATNPMTLRRAAQILFHRNVSVQVKKDSIEKRILQK